MSESEIPPPLPQPQSLTTRWIAWVGAATLLPMLPWVIGGSKTLDNETAMGMLIVTVLGQLIASIFLAIGLAKRRKLGVGGIIGLSVVFMMASVAVGTAVFFFACISVTSFNLH